MPPANATNASVVINDWTIVILRLAIAAVGGLLVTLIYRATRGKGEVTSTFPPTLVMLAILIAAVSQVIGNNVALAFSLVGALSIVRFRTVVRDTQDTAFVIFAVVIGMAAGTGAFITSAVTLAVGAIAALGMAQLRPAAGAEDDYLLTLRAGLGADANALLAPSFAKHISFSRADSVLTSKQGAALEYTYRIRLKPAAIPAEVVKELNRIEGIQNVELRRVTDDL